ncbi:AAA family ATPase [Janthinobacterium lividum]|uniref:AAA family ATPase n=1 Tax=Janthinobacterium sp. YR213 TaxID=1881027 RepID=UPI000884A4C6|nr:AAA family ATPase [Janthinobacterium sp. YR213]SDG80826.1 AAA domain-containing protein [Janthinobacterium sp. YR213]
MADLICLIGRHGVGKSTLGQALARIGYAHLNLGLLRRLAISGTYPGDIPITLMLSIRTMRPSKPLSDDVVRKLLAHALSYDRCVIDGFPVLAAHLPLLPATAKIAYVWAPAQSRNERLRSRAATTKRHWTPGLNSHRDASLCEVLKQVRSNSNFYFVRNAHDAKEEINALANFMASLYIAPR